MGKRKEFIGTVVSDKMQKTVIVKIMHLSKHIKYGKTVKKYNQFKAHDDSGKVKMGDTVRIVATRPLSKGKRFIVAEIVKKAASIHLALKEEIV